MVVCEVSQDVLDKGLARIQGFLEKAVKKGKLAPEAVAETMGRIKGTTRLGDLVKCDLVIEAVVERLEVKKAVVAELDAICPAETIFASNTSSLSITEMAAATKRPGRFVGPALLQPGAPDEAGRGGPLAALRRRGGRGGPARSCAASARPR